MPLQDWEPTGVFENGATNAETIVYFDRSSESVPVAPTINFKIKDVFDVVRPTEYTAYALVTNLKYGSTFYYYQWLNPNCYQELGILDNSKTTQILENGLEFAFIPEFRSLRSLPNSEYEFFTDFFLIGLPVGAVDDTYEFIEVYKHSLKLIITGSESPLIVGNPYEEGEKAFTLDPKFFTIKSYNTDTYFQFDAIVKAFDYFTTYDIKQYTIPQKVVLYNTISKIALGKKIHALMDKFENPNNTFLQYKFALVNIVCTEKQFSDDAVVRSQTIEDIPYIAGLSRGITDLGFLDFNIKPNRVTVNSFAYLNFIVPEPDYEIRILRNNNLVDVITFESSIDKVMCKKVLFNFFTPGDVIDYVLVKSGEEATNSPKKTYIILPEGRYSNMIVWENEFLLQSAIECTGSAQLKQEGEFQSQKTHDLFVEIVNHLSTSKEVKLFINTGWITKNDLDTVESLMRSKRAWLVRGNERIQLRSTNKALTGQDTEKELIAFPLEFIINRNYDEETYTL